MPDTTMTLPEALSVLADTHIRYGSSDTGDTGEFVVLMGATPRSNKAVSHDRYLEAWGTVRAFLEASKARPAKKLNAVWPATKDGVPISMSSSDDHSPAPPTEMVERVVETFLTGLRESDDGAYISDGDDRDGAPTTIIDGRFDLRFVARSIIEAMREPTDDMYDRTSEKLWRDRNSTEVWQSFIDAALWRKP